MTLIAVTKTHPASVIGEAYDAGLRDFGENRVQEALPKIGTIAATGKHPTWHLIGHVQTNKAAAAVERFDILHSVESERLATEISRRAVRVDRAVRVLIEVNVADEGSKFGVPPQGVEALARSVRSMPELDLIGLMTVAPRADNPDDVRPVFRRLRELRDSLGLAELSMGMTDDFEVAVEEGSTLVRVGRAIFGPRGG